MDNEKFAVGEMVCCRENMYDRHSGPGIVRSISQELDYEVFWLEENVTDWHFENDLKACHGHCHGN